MPKASSSKATRPSSSRPAAQRAGGSRAAHATSRIGAFIASAHRNSVLTAQSRELLMTSHQMPYSVMRPEKQADAPIYVFLPPEDPTFTGEILGYKSLHHDGISLRFYTSGIPNWVCADYVDSSKKPIPKPKFVTIVQLGSPLSPFKVGKYGGMQPASLVRPVSNEMHHFQFEGGDRVHLLIPACLHRVIVRRPNGECQINVMTPSVTIAPPSGFTLGVLTDPADLITISTKGSRSAASRRVTKAPPRPASQPIALTQSERAALAVQSRELAMASLQVPYSKMRPEKPEEALTPIYVFLPPEDPKHGGEVLGYLSLYYDGVSLRFYTSGIPNWVCADYVDACKKTIPKPKFVTIVQLGSPLSPFKIEKCGGIQPASLVRPVSNEMHRFQFEGGDRVHLLSPACLHRVIVHGPDGDCQINVITPNISIAPPLGFRLGLLDDPADFITIGR